MTEKCFAICLWMAPDLLNTLCCIKCWECLKGTDEQGLIVEPFEVWVKSFHRFLWALDQIASVKRGMGEKILFKVIDLFLHKKPSWCTCDWLPLFLLLGKRKMRESLLVSHWYASSFGREHGNFQHRGCLNVSVCKWWSTDEHSHEDGKNTLYCSPAQQILSQTDPPVTQSHVAWFISRVSARVRNVTSWAIYVTT